MKKPVLVHNWKQAHRFNSVRLATFWGLLNGAVLALAVFQDVVNPWLFLSLNMIGYAAIAVGRVTHQPGLD